MTARDINDEVTAGNDAKRPQGHAHTAIFPWEAVRAPEFIEKALYVILTVIYGL